MRSELYKALFERITEKVPAVKYVDLWNHNVEFIEQETAWPCPAVFIEFGEIQWQDFIGAGRRGRGTISLHIVTEWAEGQYDAAFSVGREVLEAVEGLSGREFNGLALQTSDTNHNHEELLEQIDTYGVRYLMDY